MSNTDIILFVCLLCFQNQ